jgi:hypothetical protein
MPRDNPLFSRGMIWSERLRDPLRRLSFFQNGAENRNE